MAEVVFKPTRPLVVDTNKNCDGLSRIAFMDGNAAVILGKVTEVEAKVEGKKGDDKEIQKLKNDIEEYKLKLKEEFGYTKQEINKDPDLMDMQKRYKEMGGK
jgi:hypothetical protein